MIEVGQSSVKLPRARDAWGSRGWWMGCVVIGLLSAVAEQAVYSTGLTVGPGIYVVWPVNGVALGLLVLFGWRCWPGLAVCFTLTALLIPPLEGAPDWTNLQLLTELWVDLAQLTATAWWVRWVVGTDTILGSLRQAIWLVAVAGLLGPALNTVGSIAVLMGTGLIDPGRGLLGLTLTWFASEMLGMMVFAPAIVIWSRMAAWRNVRDNWRGWALSLLPMGAACALSFSPLEGWVRRQTGVPDSLVHLAAFTLLLPAAVWMVIRFAQLGATLAMALLGVAATVGTALGHGLLGHVAPRDFTPVAGVLLDPTTLAVVETQILLGVIGGTTLLAGAVVAERVIQRDRLLDQSEQLRQLGQRMLDTERCERAALAAQLHDGPIQTLAVGQLALHALAPEQRAHCKDLQDALKEAEHQARRLLAELDPPALHLLGLHAALAGLVRKFEQRHDLPVLYDAQPPERRPSPEFEAFLYRAAHELLTNVVKHGGNRAKLVYTSDQNRARLWVWDDGPGLDLPAVLRHHRDHPDSTHYGLASIAAQAAAIHGKLRVNPNAQGGLELVLPG